MDQRALPDEQTGGKTNLSSGGFDCPFKSPNIERVELGLERDSVVWSAFEDDTVLFVNRFSPLVRLRIITKDAPGNTLYVKREVEMLGGLAPFSDKFRLPSGERDEVKDLAINASGAAVGMFKLGVVSGDRYRFKISFDKTFPEGAKTIQTHWIQIKRRFHYAVAYMKRPEGQPFGKDFDLSPVETWFDKSCFIEMKKIGECEVPYQVNVAPKQHSVSTYGLHPTCPIDGPYANEKPDFYINFVSYLFDPYSADEEEEALVESDDLYTINSKNVDILLSEADSGYLKSCDQAAPFSKVSFIQPGKSSFFGTTKFTVVSLTWEGSRCRLKLTLTTDREVSTDKQENFKIEFKTLKACKGMVPIKRACLLLGMATLRDSVGTQEDPTPKVLSTAKHELCHLFGLVPSKLPDDSKNALHLKGDHCTADPACLMHKEDPDAQNLCKTCLSILLLRRMRKLPIESFNTFSES